MFLKRAGMKIGVAGLRSVRVEPTIVISALLLGAELDGRVLLAEDHPRAAFFRVEPAANTEQSSFARTGGNTSGAFTG